MDAIDFLMVREGGHTMLKNFKVWQSFDVSNDLKLLGVNARDLTDRAKWTRAIGRKQAKSKKDWTTALKLTC